MKIIAYHNFRGGVGSTTLASNTCIYAAERGLDVVGATFGDRRDLRHHLAHADVPWCDGLERLPETCDLLVLDVHSHCKLIDVVRSDLWVMLMTDPTAVINAVRILPQLAGPALWVPTRGFTLFEVPPDLPERVSFSPPIPYCKALVHSYDLQRPVWDARRGSSGAAAVERLIRDVLARVGLAVSSVPMQSRKYHGEPTYDRDSYDGYEVRQEASRSRVKWYFERVGPEWSRVH